MTAAIDTSTATDATGAVDPAAAAPEPETNTIPREVAEFWTLVSDYADQGASAGLDDKKSDASLEIRRAYGALDKDAKRQARAIVRDAKDTELEDAGKAQATDPAAAMAHMARSFALLNVINNGFAALSSAAPKSAGDPVEAAVALTAQIQLAYAVSMATAPAGVDSADYSARVSASLTENDQSDAIAYRNWIEAGQTGDEPNVSELAKSAARISLGRSPKGQGRKPGSPNAPKDETAAADAPVDSTEGADTGE